MLGRGLESLIPKRSGSDGDSQMPFYKESVFSIEVDKIKPNPYQPRREFDKDAIADLAESIKIHGILQPLIVTKTIKEVPHGEDVEYELVAGERRLRAAKLLNFKTVPVIIRDTTPKTKLELSLIENVQREDLNAMEKALAFKQLADEFGLRHIDIAQRVGKSREVVTNTMRLLQLSPKIQQALREAKITENHARAILIIKDPKKQDIFFENIIREGLAPKDAERSARDIQLSETTQSPFSHFRHAQQTRATIRAVSPEVKSLEEKIRGVLKIQAVNVQFVKDKPKVVIKFDSQKELHQLFDKIKTFLV